MGKSAKSNGQDRTPDTGLRAAPSSAAPAAAFDAARTLFDASWSASERWWATAEALHRLQLQALDAMARSCTHAASATQQARSAEELLKAQARWANDLLEQAVGLGGDWARQLNAFVRAGAVARRSEDDASRQPRSPGSPGTLATLSPVDVMLDAQSAWMRWYQQLTDTINRGVMPS